LLLLGAAAAASEPELEPFDAVRIQCPAYPALESDVAIDALGVGSLPYGARMVLAGMTLEAAQGRVRAHFESKLGVPLGALRLLRIANLRAPVRYSGAVERSGLTPHRAGLTLHQILLSAEPTDLADLGAVELWRAGERRTVAVDLENPKAWDIPLQGGDKVFVPQAAGGREIYVFGAVVKPGAFEFKRGMTVRTALELAGGLRPNADSKRVQVERKGREVGYVDIALGNPLLQPGDTLKVSVSAEARYLQVVGGALRPGRIPYEEGMTLLGAISAAGGLDPRIAKGEVRLVRRENGKAQVRTFDLSSLLGRAIPDVPVLPEDRIELPEIRN
jgi:protein involved in polysaccharide export with SLBB domain